MKNFLIVSIRPLIAITCCFIVLSQNPAIAQVETDDDKTGVLPSQMYDTRTLSMGNTTIAEVYGRPGIGINAALSGLLNQSSFIQFSSNHNWKSNLMQQQLTLPTLTTGDHHFTARFGLLHEGFDNLPFMSSNVTPNPDVLMYRGEVAYAISIGGDFSLGTLQSISYTTTNKNEVARYWNYIADIGLAYAPDGPISYGLIFRGLGNETTYEIIETGQTTLGSRLAQQILEVGVSLRYPIEERTYLSMSFANEKRFGQDGLWYKGGFEIIPVSLISIRGGAMVNFEQSLFFPRVGLGINLGRFKFDYMIAPKNMVEEQFHQFGLTFQF